MLTVIGEPRIGNYHRFIVALQHVLLYATDDSEARGWTEATNKYK